MNTMTTHVQSIAVRPELAPKLPSHRKDRCQQTLPFAHLPIVNIRSEINHTKASFQGLVQQILQRMPAKPWSTAELELFGACIDMRCVVSAIFWEQRGAPNKLLQTGSVFWLCWSVSFSTFLRGPAPRRQEKAHTNKNAYARPSSLDTCLRRLRIRPFVLGILRYAFTE